MDKLVRQRERLAAIEAGGAPGRPIEVGSASVIEVTAESMRCTRCESYLRVEAHEAKTIDGVSLRLVTCVCKRCGARRVIHFRILTALPS